MLCEPALGKKHRNATTVAFLLFLVLLELVYAALVFSIALLLARLPIRLARHADTAVIAISFLVAIIVAQVALEAYPNSADEYGYTYLARTLAHGRLWNQAYPPELRDVLATAYIGGHGDQRVTGSASWALSSCDLISMINEQSSYANKFRTARSMP